MKVKILSFALILSFLAISASVRDSVLAQRTTKNRHRVAGIDRWYVFVSPHGDFTLSFPEKPNREADESGPDSVFKSYGLYTQNGMRFSVNFSQLPMDPNLPSANQWTDEVERSLLADDRENKRRLVSSRRIGKNTFEAEIWDASNSTGESLNYLRQTIFRRGRVYTLLCGSEILGRRVDKSICRRFFNSMHFIPDSAASRR